MGRGTSKILKVVRTFGSDKFLSVKAITDIFEGTVVSRILYDCEIRVFQIRSRKN